LAAWFPTNFEDVCKRNAGRRKLHMRKREARADRILRILLSMDALKRINLRDTTCAGLSPAAQAMKVSLSTASRDHALARRIHRQFGRMFGRSFDPKQDHVVWSWDWSQYGFIAPESKQAGYPKPVGQFPFDTRKQETEECYGEFNQLSWHNEEFLSRINTSELIRLYLWAQRTRERVNRYNLNPK